MMIFCYLGLTQPSPFISVTIIELSPCWSEVVCINRTDLFGVLYVIIYQEWPQTHIILAPHHMNIIIPCTGYFFQIPFRFSDFRIAPTQLCNFFVYYV